MLWVCSLLLVGFWFWLFAAAAVSVKIVHGIGYAQLGGLECLDHHRHIAIPFIFELLNLHQQF